MSQPFLSKSKYLIGLQCPKLLWFHYNAKDELPEIDEQTQAIFDQGHEVGELAKKLYPDGINVDWDVPLQEVLNQSQGLLVQRKPLFEAGFMFNGTYARVDVLNPVAGGKWDIIEVKSGTDVKPVNLNDVAFQSYCYDGAGVPIRKCFLMHVNNKYVRKGEIEPKGLFTKVDVTGKAKEARAGIQERITDMLATIKLKKCPEVDIGPHCSDPYDCPLIEKCWKHVNKHDNNVFTLFNLRGKKKWLLYQQGIIRNDQIPANYLLSGAQQIQLEAERTGKPHVSKDVISDFLSRLCYPLYLLDFETFQTAIPLVDGSRPYAQLPFQFSLHVVPSLDAEPDHHSWLWDGQGDPRGIMLGELRRIIGEAGSVVAFRATFEKSRLSESAEAYAKHRKWVKDLTDRFVDLLDPFHSFQVYYPSQRGTASLKAVLPALAGKSYGDLAIHEGGQVSKEFMRVTFGRVTDTERQQVRRNLEEYCGLDTCGMLDIIKALHKLAL